MKKLLIITYEQLGYQIDFYNWCLFLKDEYEITYLSFNLSLPIVKLYGVNEVLVEGKTGIFIKLFLYLKSLRHLLKNNNYSNIIVTNNQFSTLVKLFLLNKKVIHDIRTVAVFENKLQRFIYNFNWYLGTKFYTHNTIITEHIAEFYNINRLKYTVLPLGANIISAKDKKFDTLNLIYIGVIRKGFIESIIGFSKFLEIQPQATYTIIGYKDFCSIDTVQQLNETIKNLKIERNVNFIGRKLHSECIPYFDNCNVGVSFIPLLPQFDKQPPTKTFEYLLSGMVCLATSTFANKKIINDDNGIIINDNAESFTEGLKKIYINRNNYNSKIIRDTQNSNKWVTIVNDVLKPVLLKFEN